jgi:IS4 transposase
MALRHFSRVVAVDGSTLDGLIKKIGLLRETEGAVLGGKMMALLDIASQLPVKIWYGEDSTAHDQQWWEQIIEALQKDNLVLFDLGFVNYQRYQQLTLAHKYFVSRVKTNMAYQVISQLINGAGVREWLIQVGENEVGTGQLLRLVEVRHQGQWYRYLTNVLEPGRLTGAEIAYLYRQRWRIEDAFRVVKRLLGLAYFHGSSINAICVQLWATWVLYGVLIDLTDGVAEELEQPFSAISVEMVYRGLYHYSQARARGETGSVFEYLAHNAKSLGIVKQPKKATFDLTKPAPP